MEDEKLPVVEPLDDLAELAVAGLQFVHDTTVDFLEAAYGSVRSAYQAAGQPYGPSTSGMLRWFGDIAAAKDEIQSPKEKANAAIHAHTRQVAPERGHEPFSIV